MKTQNLNAKSLSFEKGYLTLQSESVRKTTEIFDFTIIGRDMNVTIPLSDPYLSARNTRIEKRSDGFFIRDLRSRNGTFVNGSRILEARLQDHDHIRTGMTEFIFQIKNESETARKYLTSKNMKWNAQLKRLYAIAKSPHPVLLLGPSGSGKEVLANAIHKYSNRSMGPFLSVNCSSLTETLAESELFGHKKFSFTGAQEDRKGAFESARGGTLFLDEIGDMPMALQPKFLRALENFEIKPVGSDATQAVDVRIIAATNKDLKKLVLEEKFREDLYFRIHILQMRPPALIDRMEDFDDLLNQFSSDCNISFSFDAMTLLRKYNWPGNIRELKNVLARASALYQYRMIEPEHICEIIDISPQKLEAIVTKTPYPRVTKQILRNFEKEAIIERLKYYNGNQRRAAEDLEIPRSTFHERVRNYDITPKDYKPTEDV
jgi:DNA-binding NtrC family response regulator